MMLEQNKHQIDNILPKLPFQTKYFDSHHQRKSSAFSNHMSPIQLRPFQVQKYIQIDKNQRENLIRGTSYETNNMKLFR